MSKRTDGGASSRSVQRAAEVSRLARAAAGPPWLVSGRKSGACVGCSGWKTTAAYERPDNRADGGEFAVIAHAGCDV